MNDFLSTYGFLMVTMVQAGLLGLSLYFPFQAGQLSLASPGFYALGGYTAAIMLTNPAFAGLRDSLGNGMFVLTWLVAALLAGLLGLLVGVPALRLRGIYLALATIAFVEIMRVVSLNLSITGGAVGIFGVPQPFGFQDRWQYIWLFLPLLLLVLLFTCQMERSRVGRAFRAIREDELAADAMGVNPTHYKVMAFVIGAVLAGVVGAMSAPLLSSWNARQGTFDASIAMLAFVLIGFFIWLAENIGTFWGVWRYTNQLGAWSVVHVSKWSSWSLLVIMTCTIVANLKHIKEKIHVARA